MPPSWRYRVQPQPIHETEDFLEKILTSVDRMSKLVDDLLDLGRIETGIGLSPEPVQISLVAQDILTTYRPQALNKRVSLEVELHDEMRPVQADPMLLRQAVSNLVDNAIKYTDSGGRVNQARLGRSTGIPLWNYRSWTEFLRTKN